MYIEGSYWFSIKYKVSQSFKSGIPCYKSFQLRTPITHWTKLKSIQKTPNEVNINVVKELIEHCFIVRLLAEFKVHKMRIILHWQDYLLGMWKCEKQYGIFRLLQRLTPVNVNISTITYLKCWFRARFMLKTKEWGDRPNLCIFWHLFFPFLQTKGPFGHIAQLNISSWFSFEV